MCVVGLYVSRHFVIRAYFVHCISNFHTFSILLISLLSELLFVEKVTKTIGGK